jgi:hypothetical protein
MPRFVEVPIVSKKLEELYDKDRFTPEDYREMQNAILQGNVQAPRIPKTGGARKVRWGTKHSGKSGGIRAILYHHRRCSIYYLVYLYAKSDVDSLSDKQKEKLKILINRLKTEIGC